MLYQIQAMVGDVGARWTQGLLYQIQATQFRKGRRRMKERGDGGGNNLKNCLFICLFTKQREEEGLSAEYRIKHRRIGLRDSSYQIRMR